MIDIPMISILMFGMIMILTGWISLLPKTVQDLKIKNILARHIIEKKTLSMFAMYCNGWGKKLGRF